MAVDCSLVIKPNHEEMSREEANAKYHHKRQHRDGNLSSGFHLRIEMKEKEEKVSSIIGF
jgi:hypothetical protein